MKKYKVISRVDTRSGRIDKDHHTVGFIVIDLIPNTDDHCSIWPYFGIISNGNKYYFKMEELEEIVDNSDLLKNIIDEE